MANKKKKADKKKDNKSKGKSDKSARKKAGKSGLSAKEKSQKLLAKSIDTILKKAGGPMHYRKIADLALAEGQWEPGKKEKPMDAVLKCLRQNSQGGSAGSNLFEKGEYGLFTCLKKKGGKNNGQEEKREKLEGEAGKKGAEAEADKKKGQEKLEGEVGKKGAEAEADKKKGREKLEGEADQEKLSDDKKRAKKGKAEDHEDDRPGGFLDSAYESIGKLSKKEPVHCSLLIERAIEDKSLDINQNNQDIAEVMMARQIKAEIEYKVRNGQMPRFESYASDHFGLTSKIDEEERKEMLSIAEKHRRAICKQVADNLSGMKENVYYEIMTELLSHSGFKCRSIAWNPGDQKFLVTRGVFISNLAIETEALVWVIKTRKKIRPDKIEELQQELQGLEKGVLISNGFFNNDAWELVRNLTDKPVFLYDGMHVADWLVRKELGVRRLKNGLYEIDKRYFLKSYFSSAA